MVKSGILTYQARSVVRKALSLGTLVCFFWMSVHPSCALAQQAAFIPENISLSPAFTPVLMRGLHPDPGNPLKFEFIIDSGDTGFEGDRLKAESERLVRYFMAALTLSSAALATREE